MHAWYRGQHLTGKIDVNRCRLFDWGPVRGTRSGVNSTFKPVAFAIWVVFVGTFGPEKEGFSTTGLENESETLAASDCCSTLGWPWASWATQNSFSGLLPLEAGAKF